MSSEEGRTFGPQTSNFKLHTLFRDGRIKLLLIHKGLQARHQNRELFDNGDYLPASVHASRSGHIIAFFRVHEDRHALVVVPRFLTSLVGPNDPPLGKDVWQDTRITLPEDASATWQDAITGRTLNASGEVLVADIFCEFPVAILIART